MLLNLRDYSALKKRKIEINEVYSSLECLMIHIEKSHTVKKRCPETDQYCFKKILLHQGLLHSLVSELMDEMTRSLWKT